MLAYACGPEVFNQLSPLLVVFKGMIEILIAD